MVVIHENGELEQFVIGDSPILDSFEIVSDILEVLEFDSIIP